MYTSQGIRHSMAVKETYAAQKATSAQSSGVLAVPRTLDQFALTFHTAEVRGTVDWFLSKTQTSYQYWLVNVFPRPFQGNPAGVLTDLPTKTRGAVASGKEFGGPRGLEACALGPWVWMAQTGAEGFALSSVLKQVLPLLGFYWASTVVRPRK